MQTQYFRPRNIDEATTFLGEHQGATILAGGTDIMVDRRSGKIHPHYLMDVSRMAELRQISHREGVLEIGAAVTISEILASEMVARLAPALGKCAQRFGSRQIRNVATIGGNVAHCSPCGDTLAPLLIHEAEAVVIGTAGSRTLTIEEVAGGPYLCVLGPDELIIRFRLKPKPSSVQFADFQKIGRRRELAISRISMAAMTGLDNDGAIDFMRFAVGACTPTPHRFRDVENFLLGRRPDEALLWQAGRLAADTMIAITGRRPSATYKKPAVQGLFLRMMAPLMQRQEENHG
jgi:CO/xanthine dehydrogenase FAD-binding subunit